VQITDCGHPLFQYWITGIEIFIDDHFLFNNEFRTGLYMNNRGHTKCLPSGRRQRFLYPFNPKCVSIAFDSIFESRDVNLTFFMVYSVGELRDSLSEIPLEISVEINGH
jgi:hypothetical protein